MSCSAIVRTSGRRERLRLTIYDYSTHPLQCVGVFPRYFAALSIPLGDRTRAVKHRNICCGRSCQTVNSSYRLVYADRCFSACACWNRIIKKAHAIVEAIQGWPIAGRCFTILRRLIADKRQVVPAVVYHRFASPGNAQHCHRFR